MARILHNSAPLDSEGCQGDSPPEAGFFQSRRASPEAHGSGSDSPACVGALHKRLGVGASRLVYSIFQPRSPRLQTHIPVHSATVCMWHASDKVLGVFRARKRTFRDDALPVAHECGNLPRARTVLRSNFAAYPSTGAPSGVLLRRVWNTRRVLLQHMREHTIRMKRCVANITSDSMLRLVR